MRKTVISVAVLLCLSAFALGANADGDNKQSGDNSDCADYNALYLVPGVHSPNAVFVEVTAGDNYTIATSSGSPWIDFYDAGGVSITYGEASGTVPPGSVYGTICVDAGTDYPATPDPLATWEYSESENESEPEPEE